MTTTTKNKSNDKTVYQAFFEEGPNGLKAFRVDKYIRVNQHKDEFKQINARQFSRKLNKSIVIK